MPFLGWARASLLLETPWVSSLSHLFCLVQNLDLKAIIVRRKEKQQHPDPYLRQQPLGGLLLCSLYFEHLFRPYRSSATCLRSNCCLALWDFSLQAQIQKRILPLSQPLCSSWKRPARSRSSACRPTPRRSLRASSTTPTARCPTSAPSRFPGLDVGHTLIVRPPTHPQAA